MRVKYIAWGFRIVLLTLVFCRHASGAELPPDTGQSLRLPESSLQDFSKTLEKPAGKRGFLQRSENGHFVWADGTRARFWGINVSSTRLNIPPKQIEQVVSNFARAGLNMVRLEAIDNRNCLLGSVDAPDSQHFDPRYLDCLDRWMDALRRHGIYYYLDLLDFRTFKEGDGVLRADSLDRGARPYALFDPYLIRLQKEYATKLLTHRNPYSGLRPVDDPALALIEICNEHGFFLYPEKLETLAEPYAGDLKGRWNLWLNERYGTRGRLEAAWGKAGDRLVLQPEEDPAQQTVLLPMLASPPDAAARIASAVRLAPARQRDGVEFLVGVQRAYFREMRTHLLSLGLRIPVTAVVSSNVAPDVASVAQECDFTSENWYGEGVWDDPRTPGVHYYSNRNSLRSDDNGGFAPYTAALRWNNKPVVIREWATTWPNQQRAASVPEALAYASLQDFDAVLLFGYQTNRAPNGALADALNDFAFQSDPSVWGLYALAGQAFLSQAIRPAKNTVTLVYPPAQQFAWPSRLSDLHRAAWSARLNSLLSDRLWGAASAIPTGTLADVQALRNVLDAVGKQGAPVGSDSLKSGVWRSDTGQITRFTREGVLKIQTPRLAVLAGELDPDKTYDLGLFRISTSTRFAALLAISLDGQTLEKSRHIVLKMVSKATNKNELLEKAAAGFPGPFALTSPGTGPVLTSGRAAPQPTRIWLVNTQIKDKTGKLVPAPPMLMLALENGTWELDMKNGQAVLSCDTPGIAGNLQGRAFTTTAGPMPLTDVPPDNEADSLLLR